MAAALTDRSWTAAIGGPSTSDVDVATSVVLGERGARARTAGRAMGTQCAVMVVAADAEAAMAATREGWALVELLDSLWSRFRPQSELSRLNAAASATREGTVSTGVDGLTSTLVAAMRWAYGYSGGIVDATVLDRVIAAGYDRDFDAVRRRDLELDRTVEGREVSPAAHPDLEAPFVSRMSEVTVDDRIVRRPAGVVLDSGGVGKGLAADLIAAAAPARGFGGVLVDLGGDIRVIGDDLDGRPWRVGAADERVVEPGNLDRGGPLIVWRVTDGAVATSSTARRRWRGGHHIIDPRTGRPSTSDIAAVTVVADTALAAETCAKTALVSGRRFAERWLPARCRAALITATDGAIHTYGDAGEWSR
ncbi:MAG TPA: FAD:protein FMN transferase [Actinomycetota bacterium]|nr:FAD:protein FMN transferase [Actinomycetota bacterium]